jgi:tetratricopeptide (TPR) repeat protein
MRHTIIVALALALVLAGCASEPDHPEPQGEAAQGEAAPSPGASTEAQPAPSPADPKSAEVEDHWRRGMQLMQEDRLAEAVQAFDRSIELAPDHAPSLASRAIAHRALGKLDLAVEDVSRAIEVTKEQPFRIDLLEFRGSVYLEAEKYAEGDADLTQVIDGGKDDAELRLYRAICRLETGKLDEAMADVEKALQAAPNDGAKSVLFEVRGRVKEQKGDLEGALADFEKAASLGNDQVEEHQQRVRKALGR